MESKLFLYNLRKQSVGQIYVTTDSIRLDMASSLGNVAKSLVEFLKKAKTDGLKRRKLISDDNKRIDAIEDVLFNSPTFCMCLRDSINHLNFDGYRIIALSEKEAARLMVKGGAHE